MAGDHLQCVQDLLPNIYMYIHHLFTLKENDVCLLLQVKIGAFHLRTSVHLLRTLVVFICERFCISFAHFFSILKHCMHSSFKVYINGGRFKGEITSFT